MAVSLTQDEFIKRFYERKQLFLNAILHDLEQIANTIKVRHTGPDVRIDLSIFAGTLISNAVLSAIDIVYQGDTLRAQD